MEIIKFLFRKDNNEFTKEDESVMRDLFEIKIRKPIDVDVKDYIFGTFLSYEDKIDRYKKDKELIDYEIKVIYRRSVERKLDFRDVDISYDKFPLMKLSGHYNIITNVLGEPPIETAVRIKEEVGELHSKLIETLNIFNAEYEKILKKETSSEKDTTKKSYSINYCEKIIYLIHNLRYKLEYYEYLYKCLDEYETTFKQIERIKDREIKIRK